MCPSRDMDREASSLDLGAKSTDTLDLVGLPAKKKQRGRVPGPNSKGNGYLQLQIVAAEAAVKQLAEKQERLEEENELQSNAIEVCASGISAADAHLSFLLISQCAFSRQARAVLTLEAAKQVKLGLWHHLFLSVRHYSP